MFTSRFKFESTSQRGFTLLELLVVIAIIGLLSTVVLASLAQAREKARDASRASTMREIRNAMELYITEYGQYPNGYEESGGCSSTGTYNQASPPGGGPTTPPFSGTLAATQRCSSLSDYYPAEPKDPLGVPTSEYGYMRLINPEGYVVLVFQESAGAFCQTGTVIESAAFSAPECVWN